MKFSQIARPPITEHEARDADTAICVFHNGLIRQTGDREGRVLFCPIGREFWRYTSRAANSFTSALPYPNTRIV